MSKGLRDYAGRPERQNTNGNGRRQGDGAGEYYGDTGRDSREGNRRGPDDASMHGGALVPIDDSENLPALMRVDESGPMVIPGTGISMGTPFIKRRERPLTLRLGMLALMGCLLVTGLFAVTPLGSNANGSISSFQALSGAVVWNKTPGFFWYTVAFGDTPEKLSKQFNVQVGGIYELNNLLAGQELNTGTAYKIPTDPNFGKNYRPPSYIVTTGASGSRFGSSPWTSYAGNPPAEMPCGPKGNGTPGGFQLKSPNWNSNWVRGFTWYHNGVDMSAPSGNPIHAAQAGQVIWSGWDVGGLGWSIKVDNCNGISTIYGHMLKTLKKTGDPVSVGEVIGLEGSTGWSTGPHLHFMVMVNNNPVDPMAYYNYNNYQITHYVS